MPGGGFGQNGSVAWIVKPKNAGSSHNHSNQGNGHGGTISEAIDLFTVRLRFPSQADAQNAWNNRKDVSGQWPEAGYVLTLQVPAQAQNANRTFTNVNPNDEPNVNPPWEIHVDW